MTREQIKKIFPDITDDQMKELLDINSADIGKAKGDYEKVKADLEQAKESVSDYEKQIASLKESVDKGENFKKKFEDLEKQIADEKAEAERKEKEAAEEAALSERFKTVVGENKWRDELTERAVYSEFKNALAEEANKGKGDKDILEALTKDKGYWSNPNRPADMSGFGKVNMNEVSEDQARAVMGLAPKK